MMSSTEIPAAVSTDEQLMRQFQAGNEGAFTMLVQRYQQRLYHYLIRYTRNHEDTEDIIQETFMRVYNSRNAYEEVARFSTWLYTIAGNLMRTQFKKRQRMQTSSISASAQDDDPGTYSLEIPDTHLTPEEHVNSSLTMSMIRKALNELPEEYSELLNLREYKDLSYEEISEAVNLPMGTVKSRINRGRNRLQSMLSGIIDKESVYYAA
ncbi:MAG: sigma-70 family RNA polymerase sigma factor [Balneolia bacterium]|nr:sigma-70 family RNA polymerase sigma factor [Balneolia bacterium]